MHAAYIRRVFAGAARFELAMPGLESGALGRLATPLCGVVGGFGQRESPPSAGRAYGGLVVYEGSLPLHEAHLPAAKGDRVLLGPLAVDGLVRSIERAVPGIHRQRHFDGAQGPHGSSFVRGLPGGSEAFQDTHILGHVQAMCVERVRGCGLARSICVYAALSESASRGSRRTLRRLSAWRLRSGSQPVNRLLPCAFCAPYGEGSRCSMRGPRDNV